MKIKKTAGMAWVIAVLFFAVIALLLETSGIFEGTDIGDPRPDGSNGDQVNKQY